MIKSIAMKLKAKRKGGKIGGMERKGKKKRERHREAWSIEYTCTFWRVLLQKGFFSGEAFYLIGAGFMLR